MLLRQTSFKALEETVLFAGQKQGTHTARFGEIEQRGVHLRRKGDNCMMIFCVTLEPGRIISLTKCIYRKPSAIFPVQLVFNASARAGMVPVPSDAFGVRRIVRRFIPETIHSP
ncbi:2-oxoadipate dioxygenase/decarboxylase family protein [Escherichia coli]